MLLLLLEDLKCFQPPSHTADPTMTPPLPSGISTFAAPFGMTMSAVFARLYGSQKDTLLLLLLLVLLLLLSSRMLLRAKPPFSPGCTMLSK
jgi:hypothetical protein